MDGDNELISTDDAILDSIGEGDEQTTDDGVEEEDTGETSNTKEEASKSGGEQGTEGQLTNEQQGSARGPQDLVDRNGNVIAKGGAERRHFETAQREKARADQLTREVEIIQGQLNAIKSTGSLGTQYSLSPEELTTGAQLISAYKNDPVQAIQYMLTQAQANGYNVDSLMGGGGMDPQAIKAMIENAVSPLLSEHRNKADTQEAENRAREIYDSFISKYPDAPVHEDALSRLLQQDPNLSVDAAYFKLRSYYAERGLDWTKDLTTLQAEISSRPVASVMNTPQPPDGGSVNPNRVTDSARVADVSTSTDDIIRQAMDEAGIR